MQININMKLKYLIKIYKINISHKDHKYIKLQRKVLKSALQKIKQGKQH